MHCVGTLLVFIGLLVFLVTRHWLWLIFMPLAGYGLAWIGHFLFEKNKPATFRYPIYSFIADLI